MPPAVDLFTEIRKARQIPGWREAFSVVVRNTLFLRDIILVNFCAEVAVALPGGCHGVLWGAYSQSYPQNLWVRHFLLSGNYLRPYAKTLSSIGRQPFDLK